MKKFDKEQEEEQDITRLNCKHCFHTECIDKWNLISPNCPLCEKKNNDG